MAEKAKTKRASSEPIESTRFIAAWLFASVIVWPVSGGMFLITLTLARAIIMIVTLGNVDINLLPVAFGYIFYMTVAGISIGFSIGILQKVLITDVLHARATRWVTYSVLGGLIAAAIFTLFYFAIIETTDIHYMLSNDMPIFAVFMGLLFTSGSIGQWVQLRKLVHDAWLWVLAHAIAGIASTMILLNLSAWLVNPYVNDDGMWIVSAIAASVLSLGGITGMTLLWLFNNRRIVQPKGKSVPDATTLHQIAL